MMTAEQMYQNILEMPIGERERLFLFIARWGFVKEAKMTPKKSLARFCGQWQGEWDAEDIIAEIYAGRHNNTRAERMSL